MGDMYLIKSAKMWLNEICVKQLVKVKYETGPVDPNVNPPTFLCKCVIAYTDRKYEGKTKKDTEQEAAHLMLEKIGMTAAKLAELNSASKKSGSNPSPAAENNEGDVSDTDEVELNAAFNPIGDLTAVCLTQNFDAEPEYKEEKMEGPPHKRVFTVRCTLRVPTKGICVSMVGRRGKLKTAKKLAALRVLREVNKLGFTYAQFQNRPNSNTPSLGEPSSSTQPEDEVKKPEDDIPEIEVDSEEELDMEPDLKKSMKKFGGPIALLRKTVKELGGRIKWYIVPPRHITTPGSAIIFLEIIFPFNFKYTVPKKSALFARGSTENDAKVQAAISALNYFKEMFTDETVSSVFTDPTLSNMFTDPTLNSILETSV